VSRSLEFERIVNISENIVGTLCEEGEDPEQSRTLLFLAMLGMITTFDERCQTSSVVKQG
jgi:hypothetical protein